MQLNNSYEDEYSPAFVWAWCLLYCCDKHKNIKRFRLKSGTYLANDRGYATEQPSYFNLGKTIDSVISKS